MSKAQWGTKHLCQNCSARFYDMKKAQAVCPKCGTPATVEKKAKAKKPAPAPVVEETPKKPAPARAAATDEDDAEIDVDLDEVDLDDDDEDEEDGLMEDASDLVDDDVTEVMEHVAEDEDKG